MTGAGGGGGGGAEWWSRPLRRIMNGRETGADCFRCDVGYVYSIAPCGARRRDKNAEQ